MAASKKKAIKKTGRGRAPKEEVAEAVPTQEAMMGFATSSTRGKQKADKKAKDEKEAAEKKKSSYIIAPIGDYDDPTVYRHPTGIIDLDIQLAGGWPCGGISVVGGEDNVGKSYLLFLTMAYMQRLLGRRARIACFFTESTIPYNQMIKCGCRIAVPDNAINYWNEVLARQGRPTYTPEQILYLRTTMGTVDYVRADTGQSLMNVLIDFVQGQKYDLILVDSITSVAPEDTIEKPLEDENKQAAHASLVNRTLNKLSPAFAMSNGVNKTLVLMTQQMRANRNKGKNPYAPDVVLTGSVQLKHAAFDRVLLSDGELVKKTVDKVMLVTGKTLKWKFDKGKAGSRDNQYGEVQFDYGIEPFFCDIAQMLLDAAIARKLIAQEQKGAVHLLQASTGASLVRLESMKQLKQWVQADFNNELAMRNEVLSAAGVMCFYQQMA